MIASATAERSKQVLGSIPRSSNVSLGLSTAKLKMYLQHRANNLIHQEIFRVWIVSSWWL